MTERAVTEKQSWDLRIARWISNVLNPPLVAAVGIVAMSWFMGGVTALRWAGLFIVLAVVAPTSYVIWLLVRGEIEDFHISNREKRDKPYMVIIGTNLVAAIVMYIFDAPFLLTAFSIIGVVQSTLLFLINKYWKISGHMTAISGFSAFVLVAMGWSASPTLIMVPLVAWARVRTDSHSLWQTVAGTLTGFFFIGMTAMIISISCGGNIQTCA